MIKPAPEPMYALEERLQQLRHVLARHAHDGVQLNPQDIANLTEALQDCEYEASKMRMEISRERWNGRAAIDPLAEVVIEEAKRPGTNLVLFAFDCRPIPGGAPQLWQPDDGDAS